jgi:hypothetical protein
VDLVVVTNEFDDVIFAENVDTVQHVEEDDETTISESGEENMQPSVDTAPDASVSTIDKGNETNMPSLAVTPCGVPTSSRINWSSYYIDKEFMALKLKLINLQGYPNHNGISHIESAICDGAVVDDERKPRVR